MVGAIFVVAYKGNSNFLKPIFLQGFFVYAVTVLVASGFALCLYTNYVLGPIIFSIIFYGAVILYWSRHASSWVKYRNNKIDLEEAQKLKEEMDEVMKLEKPYLNHGFSLNSFADRLGYSSKKVSQVLNDNYEMGFSAYANGFKVGSACELILKNEEWTLEAIGLESGFKSRSSFFAAFKKYKGVTPRQYKEANS